VTKTRLKCNETSSTKTRLKCSEFSSTKTRLKLRRIKMTKTNMHFRLKTKTKSKIAAKINTDLNKNRLRSKLSDSHLHDILRISTSAVKPDLAYLLKSRSQYHPSH